MSDQPTAVYGQWRFDEDYWLFRPLREGEGARIKPGSVSVSQRDGNVYCQHTTQAALIDAGVDVGDEHDRVGPAMCAVLLRDR
jgi:hypothetical protein